jgi:hypothetical protein
MAALAKMGPGTPDHDLVAGWFLKVLDRTKLENPSILTVQGMVEAVRKALEEEDSPLTPEVGEALMAELTDMAEDLRNAALSYGAPVDIRRLMDTPVACQAPEGERTGDRNHIDVLLLDHMTQVADRNSNITAMLLEVFAWCQLHGKEGRFLVVVPEVESPGAAFIQKRPFAQRLTATVLDASKGTGLLASVTLNSFDDTTGMPRFGTMILQKSLYDEHQAEVEQVLLDQGIAATSWSRLSMLRPEEWALAAGMGWSKWHRFSPAHEAVAERQLDTEALGRLLPTEARDAFRYAPSDEEDPEACAEDDEKTPEPTEDQRAAAAVEDAEDLLSYTTERKPRATDSRMHQEVQELLKRKLEEKERAKEAQRYELKEIDLVEGEEPSDIEMSAHTPRPLSDGAINDNRATDPEGAPQVHLHADDLQVDLAVLEAQEADEARKKEGGEDPDVVVDLDKPDEGWESVSVEVALGAEPEEPRPSRIGDDEEEEEEIIIEVDDDD